MKRLTILLLCSILLFMLSFSLLEGQTEVMAWGNITGIRIDGQLMEFETALCVAGTGWSKINSTGKEWQRPKYDREGEAQTVTTAFADFSFTQTVKENGRGSANVKITAAAGKDTTLAGVFLSVTIPSKYYSEGTLSVDGSSRRRPLSEFTKKEGLSGTVNAKSAVLRSEKRELSFVLDKETPLIIRKSGTQGDYVIYFGIMGPSSKKGEKAEKSIIITASGTIDKTPAEINIDAFNPGRRFDGFGGNFRIQNPKADPLVINYCLDNMRVAWGRVEMPWAQWHPSEDTDPVALAKDGKLNGHVLESMQIAGRLAAKGIPVIVSAWFPPKWAVLPNSPELARRVRGNALDPAKSEKIYKSIGDYIMYLKQYYGVEAVAFSFNESDLGIDVRQTGEEHRDFIRGMGAHLASRGLDTRMLLGDNSDATTFRFIIPALNDPETHKYIYAVSFHSWRGCDDETLKRWAGAAQKLNVPLLVGEGSTDAAAWNYPEIFFEETFALYEINLYIRICAISQPLSILQWQLTSDYSVMSGEGIFRTQGPLTPTRRFWNLKQLAATPENSFSLPVKCSNDDINCAAFGNIATGKYAIHLVNNGTGREININGLPDKTGPLDVFVTDATKGMQRITEVLPAGGKVIIEAPPAAMISLISK